MAYLQEPDNNSSGKRAGKTRSTAPTRAGIGPTLGNQPTCQLIGNVIAEEDFKLLGAKPGVRPAVTANVPIISPELVGLPDVRK